MNDMSASAVVNQSKQAAITTRPLCPLERWYWVFGQISPLNGIARVRVHGKLDDATLSTGLQLLQQRHPLLRSKVITNDKGRDPRFVIDNALQIPLTRTMVAGAYDPQNWTRFLREQALNRPFDTARGPLMRLHVVEDNEGVDLIVVASHIIIDATGIVSLLKELLQLALGDDQERYELPLMPSFSDRFPPHKKGFVAFLKTLYLNLKIELYHFRNKPVQMAFDNVVPHHQRVTAFVHQELSAQDTQALVKACQQHGASVHAALCTALMQTIIEDVQARDPAQRDKELNVGIGSPVNLRKDMHPVASESELGIFVGTFITFAERVNGRDFWDVAREFNQTMRQQSQDGEPFTIMNFVRKTMPQTAASAGGFIKLIEKKGPGNACISNLGRYDFPAQIGGLGISGAQFLAETSVTGTWVSTANTSHGQLFWNFSYTRDMFTDARATALANRCIAILQQQLQ